MDYKLIWSPDALADIEAIGDYISRDSAFYAESIEPPHKLEKEVFNAKKIGIIFQNDAKETEKKLHITKNGNKS
jgi:hypothetical protein